VTGCVASLAVWSLIALAAHPIDPRPDPAARAQSYSARAARPSVARPAIPPQRPTPRDDASDAEIVEALSAVDAAGDFEQMIAAVARHQDVIASTRVVALIDAELQNPTLDSARRRALALMRELSIDCRERGALPAARLLSVRAIAGAALAAESPAQFAGVLEKFGPLAPAMDAELVRVALERPENTWPPPLLPLMLELARDWQAQGPLAAARRMADAAAAAGPVASPATTSGSALSGRWRSTRIIFDQPQDEHLLLRGDGGAETWIATASGREPARRGRWRTDDRVLLIDWDDGSAWSQPYTFHESQLVFPNVPGRRQFWERIE
jgi:hypothetical protein